MYSSLHRFVIAGLLGAPLFACAGQVATSHSAPVEGTVVDGLGQPAPGVKVLLDDAVVTTDAAGRFMVAGVGATYDLALSASADRAFVYQGMTTRTPLVRLDETYLSPDESEALVHVDATGLGLDAPMWFNATPSVAPGEPENAIELVDATSWRVRWAGHDPIHVGFFATGHEGVPYERVGHFVGAFAAPPVPLRPGETRSFAIGPATLVPAEETSVIVETHLPPSYGVTQAVLWEGAASDVLPGAGFDVMTQSSEMSFFVPKAGRRLGLAIEASAGDATSAVYVDLATGGKTVVDIPAAPSALSPPQGATDVGAGTELRWTPVAGTTNFALVYDGGGGSAPRIQIAAADGVARIPDLAPIGVVLPSHAQVAWVPCTVTPARSVDDFARSSAAVSLATPHVTTTGAIQAFVTR